MNLEATHTLLVGGENQGECKSRVIHFFQKNFLVRYDRIVIVEEKSCSAERSDFWVFAEEKMEANRRAVAALVSELQESGFQKISDLKTMGQGYESKILHVVTHLLDGFFGADTVFYNLEEDSHWLSDKLVRRIKEQPGKFWLLEVACSSAGSSDRLDQIRRFEVKPGD
ncbi:MAG: hypothetical protein KKG47_03630 [Proteobacteria bacterium]|nr:hypothetical protein [Pseudomonadota bacterium]MBU1739309.1 hypothetical protein [Pseudomonadota bacterium]